MKALLLALSVGSLNAARLPPPPLRPYRVVWKKPLVARQLLEYRPVEPAGPAADPATRAVIAGTRDGRLRAFASDGTPLWDFDTGGPVLAPPRVEGSLVYAGSSSGKLFALELGSGKLVWSYDCREEVGSQPVVGGGVVYFSTLQDTLFAVDAASGAWKWHRRHPGAGGMTIHGVAGPALAAGVVYGAWSDGTVAALDAATGDVRWERRVAPPGAFTDVDSTPQVAGDRVFVAAFSGAVMALEARSGKLVWEAKAPGASRLALSGDVLVAVALREVLALSARDGSPIWSAPLRGEPAGDPVVGRGRVLVPDGRGLLVLDRSSGRLLRVFAGASGVSGTPALVGERVYGVTNGGVLYALDLT